MERDGNHRDPHALTHTYPTRRSADLSRSVVGFITLGIGRLAQIFFTKSNPSVTDKLGILLFDMFPPAFDADCLAEWPSDCELSDCESWCPRLGLSEFQAEGSAAHDHLPRELSLLRFLLPRSRKITWAAFHLKCCHPRTRHHYV